ncbi:MAG: hypothetical protein HYV07_24155 [Deltaproteobacteria bacterium]|nr:hypothetical protein [Deltaproteobacteria bacterium]
MRAVTRGHRFKALVFGFAVPLSACEGIIFEDFEGSFKAKFEAKSTGEDPNFEDTKTVDPNDNADVKNHRDSIVAGSVQVNWVQATIIEMHPDNKAEWGWGELRLRQTGVAEYPEAPIATFSSVPLVAGQSYRIDFGDPANKQYLVDLVFKNPDGKIDAYMFGGSDVVPVHFDVEVEFNLSGEVAGP